MKKQTAAVNSTSGWGGSGSGMLGPMTAPLSSVSFFSNRPAAITAACCSATRAASSSWNSKQTQTILHDGTEAAYAHTLTTLFPV